MTARPKLRMRSRTAPAAVSTVISANTLGREIIAKIKAAEKREGEGDLAKSTAYAEAEAIYIAAGKILIEARELVPNFRAFLKECCNNLSPDRAYQFIRIAGGKVTVDEERAKTAERVRKHRAAAKCQLPAACNGHTEIEQISSSKPKPTGSGSGTTAQPAKDTPEWLLSEVRYFLAHTFAKMDDATLAEAKALVAAWDGSRSHESRALH